VTKNEGDFVLVAEISEPIPTEHTFDPDDDVVKIRKNQIEELFCICLDVFMDFGFPLLVDDADVHFPGMQIDAAIVLVLLIVESHSLASFHY
jgi:hypothetical protein